MDKNRSFAEILKQEMAQQGEKTFHYAPPSEPAPSLFFDWHPQKIFKKWPPQTPKGFYLKSQRKPDIKSSPPTKDREVSLQPTEKKLSFADFSPQAQACLNHFQTLGAKINANAFYSVELKKEYRRLAKRFHPDLKSPESSAKSFQQLTLLYQKIEKEIEKGQGQSQPNPMGHR